MSRGGVLDYGSGNPTIGTSGIFRQALYEVARLFGYKNEYEYNKACRLTPDTVLAKMAEIRKYLEAA